MEGPSWTRIKQAEAAKGASVDGKAEHCERQGGGGQEEETEKKTLSLRRE